MVPLIFKQFNGFLSQDKIIIIALNVGGCHIYSPLWYILRNIPLGLRPQEIFVKMYHSGE